MQSVARSPLLVVLCLFALPAAADEPAATAPGRPALAVTARLEGHTGLVRCLAFHPDGKAFVTGGSDRSLRFWDFAERMEKRKHVLPPSG